MIRRICILCLVLTLLGIAQFPIQAQGTTLPSGFTQSLFAGNLLDGAAMAFAPDGRLFVLQQTGAVRIIQNGTLLPTPFATISVNSDGERGLLGIAFDPNFLSNNYLYLYYTAPLSPARHRVSRFTANGNLVVPGSEQILITLDNQGSSPYHNGGAMNFGADGRLYIATGDNYTPPSSQSFSSTNGKLLRINSDGSIPTDNPFYSTTSGIYRAIWALGLRNPFTFGVQPGTGLMYINDVGSDYWEEINQGRSGANYGWPNTEGPTNNPAYDSPVYAYEHIGSPPNRAIVGAAFYNPATVQFPADYVGDYFFGDYVYNWIRRYDIATNTAINFASNIIPELVDLDVGPDGSLYYLARANNVAGQAGVYRIAYAPFVAPSFVEHPASQITAVGTSVTFTCRASGNPTPTLQWQRNGANITGATGENYTLSAPALADNGAVFRCVATNTAGSATSDEATLTVINGQYPNPAITQPAVGTRYRAGQTISFAGTATDPDEGTLPPSAFTWWALLHHDDHTHPFLPPQNGITGGSFTLPTTSHGDPDIFYRIYLTVTDSTGLSRTVTRDILPETTSVTVNSSPSGRQIEIDGAPRTTPYSAVEVIGTIWQLKAITPQTQGSSRYEFWRWSDGGAATHNVTIPPTNAVFTAIYLTCPIDPNPSPANAAPQLYAYRIQPVILTWSRVAWAQGYQVQVDDNASFNSPEFSQEVSADVLALPVELLPNCTYYWRVRARRDSAGSQWGSWSAAQRIVIAVP